MKRVLAFSHCSVFIFCRQKYCSGGLYKKNIIVTLNVCANSTLTPCEFPAKSAAFANEK